MKFFGAVGFQIGDEEKRPGIVTGLVVEKQYYGEVLRNSRTSTSGDKVNNDLSVTNSITIVADAFAHEHFFAIRYVRWAGQVWEVPTVDAQTRPRLILSLGGVYNGEQANPSS